MLTDTGRTRLPVRGRKDKTETESPPKQNVPVPVAGLSVVAAGQPKIEPEKAPDGPGRGARRCRGKTGTPMWPQHLDRPAKSNREKPPYLA
jgi:hypothetical protein